ncbi:MAG TPA: hypothetical protein VMV56_02910 [Williamwhitmania sp.]|nr:hypothetical protein [Williamwhitmania sp.]
MRYKIAALVLLLLPLWLEGQVITGFNTLSGTKNPELYWIAKNMPKPNNFKVFRSGMEKKEFKEIGTIHLTEMRHDTLVFLVIDTTLTKEGLYQYYIEVKTADSTTVHSDILFGHNLPNIPKVMLTSFTAEPAKDRKAIHLQWKLNYGFTVKSLSLFRSKKFDTGYQLVASLPADAVEYTDPVDFSNEAYFYFIQINDFFGYQLPSIRIHGFSTFKETPYPPQDFKLAHKEGSVELTWKNVGSNVVGNKIYRQISTVTNGNAANKFFPCTGLIKSVGERGSFTDTILKSNPSVQVSYYVVAVSDGYVESNPSETLTVVNQGPAEASPPKELSYVIDSLQNLMLIWTRQNDDPQIAGCNIYKSGEGLATTKLNKKLVPVGINYFTDENFSGYGQCTYEVEAVSVSGAPCKVRANINVGPVFPRPRVILSLQKTDKGISVEWSSISAKGIKRMELYRQAGDDKPTLLTTIKNGEKTSYLDLTAKPGGFYVYSVVAILNDNTKLVINEGVGIKD